MTHWFMWGCGSLPGMGVFRGALCERLLGVGCGRLVVGALGDLLLVAFRPCGVVGSAWSGRVIGGPCGI